MKNKTVYDVLESVMKDYVYTLKKTGNKIEINGSVTIKSLNQEVTFSKEFIINSDDDCLMEKRITGFKDEFRKKVADVIRAHSAELLDDDLMIEKLNQKIVELQEENKALRESIKNLEDEKAILQDKLALLQTDIIRAPYSPYNPYPEQTPPNPYYEPWNNKIWCETDTTNNVK